MSVVGRAIWWLLVAVVAMGGTGFVHAGGVGSSSLIKAQLATAYQPVELVSLSDSLARVDSVEWLVDQLKLADAVGRDDIVESTLERLFAIEENSLVGLYYQANMYFKRKQPELASQTYQRLAQLAPNATETKKQATLLAIHTDKKIDYQRAKLLAKSGRYKEAIKAYKALFPHGMPSAAIELEYLRLKGNLESNWVEVKRDLERLNAEFAGVPQFQLALADHIRKQDPSNPWIFEIFEKLALNPIVGTSAASSWLRALEQLPISAEVVEQHALLASYYPTDFEIQQAYIGADQRWVTEQNLRKDPTYLAKLKGLKLLDEGKTDQAAKQLRYALTTRPEDPQLLGGMGKVHLRYGQQKEALRYFLKAQKLDRDPDNAAKWTALVETAQYWVFLDKGDALFAKEEFKQAERFYRKALKLDRTQPYAFTSLGSLYHAQQQYPLADKMYRQALKIDSLNSTALRGRLDILTEQNDWQGAALVASRYNLVQQQAMAEKIKGIKSEILVRRLRVAIARNDREEMSEAANELIALEPVSPWQRLDIADVLRTMGETSRADDLMANWSQTSSDPEMKFAHALYLSEHGNLDQAIAELESVPEQDMTVSMRSNLTRLKLDSQLEGLANRYRTEPQAITAMLRELETEYAGQVRPLARVVSAWTDIDLDADGERVYRTISASEQWSMDEQLAYGSMMVNLNQFDDFDDWFEQVSLANAAQDTSVANTIELDELHSRRTLSQADMMLAEQRAQNALALFEQIAMKSEPYKTDAEIGMLAASAMAQDEAVYHDTHIILQHKSEQLNAAQLMTVATVFNQQGYRDDANSLNIMLDDAEGADALAYRSSMSIAMDNQQWDLAENRAYQALNSDRIEKSSEPQLSENPSPSLRELYDSADDYWLTRNVKTDINVLRDRTDGHIMIGWDYSARDGNNGASQVPIEARIPVESMEGHLILRSDYVSVDSGDLDYFEKRPSAVDNSDSETKTVSENASGVALGIGWQAKDWRADIGTTPIGFDQTTWVGGVSVDGDLGEFGWTAELSRRPETSSTLSYAGMSVPEGTSDKQGTEWGGVVRNGVKLNASWDIGGPYGFWSSLQLHNLTGENVASNTRLGLLGGAYYKLIFTDNQRLSIGANLMYLSYDKNLSEYTLDHGGYYSPQSYVSASLPVNFYGRYDETWSYLLRASVSNSWSQEDAPYKAEEGSASKGGGVGTSFQAAVEKRVSKHWYVGAQLDLQRSEFYTPNHFMIYAKYTFNDRWQPIEYPPQPPILYSDF